MQNPSVLRTSHEHVHDGISVKEIAATEVLDTLNQDTVAAVGNFLSFLPCLIISLTSLVDYLSLIHI